MPIGAPGSLEAPYYRRIALEPGPGVIEAEMEDFVHHFAIRLEHRHGVIVAAEAIGRRVPWETCAAGAAGLAALVGTPIAAAIDVDVWAPDRSSQCVHVVDLALLAVRHTSDAQPTLYDILVAPGAGVRRRAALRRNERLAIEWSLTNETIVGPESLAGVSLARTAFFAGLAAKGIVGTALEQAVVLRRACTIGRSRGIDLDSYTTAADIRQADDSCFTYRVDVAPRARRIVGTTRATEQEGSWL